MNNILSEHDFLMLIRNALLLAVDAIEQKLGMPRTKDIRAQLKKLKKQ